MQHPDSLKRHISHLENSHSEIDKKLIALEKNYQGDSLEAHKLKKKKLMLKDEIVRCTNTLEKMVKH